MPNVVKTMMIRQLAEELKDAEGMLMVNLSGLTVAETEALRVKLAENDVPLRMVPNRLARLALADRGFQTPDGMLKGNLALSWGGPEAAIHAAKVVKDAPAKKDGRLSYVGAVLEGNVLGPDDAAAMADMPGKNELRSMLLGCLSGPARGLVMCLAGNGAGLARVIQAHVDAAPAGGAGEASPEAEG